MTPITPSSMSSGWPGTIATRCGTGRKPRHRLLEETSGLARLHRVAPIFAIFEVFERDRVIDCIDAGLPESFAVPTKALARRSGRPEFGACFCAIRFAARTASSIGPGRWLRTDACWAAAWWFSISGRSTTVSVRRGAERSALTKSASPSRSRFFPRTASRQFSIATFDQSRNVAAKWYLSQMIISVAWGALPHSSDRAPQPGGAGPHEGADGNFRARFLTRI